MRAKGHTSASLVKIKGQPGKDQVLEEPERNRHPRRQGEFPAERPEENQAEIPKINVHARSQEQVSAHTGADRARCSPHRNVGREMLGAPGDVSQAGDKSAQEIKAKEPPSANDVLHAAAKEKQKKHVAEQVEKAGVDEHRGKVSVPGGVGGNQPNMFIHPNCRGAALAEKETERDQVNQDVDAHEREGHHRSPRGLVIHSDW